MVLGPEWRVGWAGPGDGEFSQLGGLLRSGKRRLRGSKVVGECGDGWWNGQCWQGWGGDDRDEGLL